MLKMACHFVRLQTGLRLGGARGPVTAALVMLRLPNSRRACRLRELAQRVVRGAQHRVILVVLYDGCTREQIHRSGTP